MVENGEQKMTIKIFMRIALFAILAFMSITCSKIQKINKFNQSENKEIITDKDFFRTIELEMIL